MTQILLYQVAKWIKGVSTAKSFLGVCFMSTFLHSFFSACDGSNHSASNSNIPKKCTLSVLQQMEGTWDRQRGKVLISSGDDHKDEAVGHFRKMLEKKRTKYLLISALPAKQKPLGSKKEANPKY